jgi:hypothetical protein
MQIIPKTPQAIFHARDSFFASIHFSGMTGGLGMEQFSNAHRLGYGYFKTLALQ